MSLAMTERKKKPKPPGRPATGRQTPIPLSVRISQAHLDALRAATAISHRTLSTETLVAIEAHLTALGLWPPPPPTA
jgi:hypothetical protein